MWAKDVFASSYLTSISARVSCVTIDYRNLRGSPAGCSVISERRTAISHYHCIQLVSICSRYRPISRDGGGVGYGSAESVGLLSPVNIVDLDTRLVYDDL